MSRKVSGVGSLRNPVGPLPSSIYWRRRAVALSVVALLSLLALWVFSLGGGGGDPRNQAGGGPDDEPGAASSITPGPSATESLDDSRPGGRDESGTGGSGGDDGASGDGDGGSDGSGASDGSDGESGGSGGEGASGDGKNGDAEPGASGGGDVDGLPVCAAGKVKLSLVAVRNTYAPDERPRLRLTVDNTGGSACRVGVGPEQAVVTVVDADDETVWSSEHCAEPGDAAQLRVPGREKVDHTIEWDRRGSAPGCSGKSRAEAEPGTYLAEIAVPRLGTAQTSFVLAKD